MKLTENFIREGIINADDKEIIEFGLTRIKRFNHWFMYYLHYRDMLWHTGGET